MASLCEGQKKRSASSISTSSSTSSHTTADTWPTPHNIKNLCQYAIDLFQTCDFNEASSPFQRRFGRFLKISSGKATADTEAEETLHEHKKKAQEHAKQQAGTRRIVARDEVLTAGNAAERIYKR